MAGVSDIVITGIGCVTPIGIGRESFYRGLLSRQCAIEPLITLSDSARTTYYGARIKDFDGKKYVTPRKALKVMGREVQVAYAAAHLAWRDACLTEHAPEPSRIGVCYGSEMTPGDIDELTAATIACVEDGQLNASRWGQQFAKHIYPLWMLKYLPNMAACHVGIAVDARGPNNSIALEEASGLLALGEAASIISRGGADLMVVGAAGARVTPTRMMYRARGIYDQHPAEATPQHGPRCIPFDRERRGIVSSEGAAALIVENRRHAMRRGANILGVLKGYSSRCATPEVHYGGSRTAIASAAQDALDQANISPDDLALVAAQGFSARHLDKEEAMAIAQVADGVPVTAFSSYFGTAGAACGLMELAAGMLSVLDGRNLPTLGTQNLDPECPINLLTTGNSAAEVATPAGSLPRDKDHVLKLSFTPHGQAAAVVVQCLR